MREALRERQLGLLVDYADVLGGPGDHSSSVDVLLKVTAARPWHEGAHRALMSALAATGRRYDARAVSSTGSAAPCERSSRPTPIRRPDGSVATGPVTGFDGDGKAGVQMLNSGTALLP